MHHRDAYIINLSSWKKPSLDNATVVEENIQLIFDLLWRVTSILILFHLQLIYTTLWSYIRGMITGDETWLQVSSPVIMHFRSFILSAT